MITVEHGMCLSIIMQWFLQIFKCERKRTVSVILQTIQIVDNVKYERFRPSNVRDRFHESFCLQ
jgi:hypothetical protein